MTSPSPTEEQDPAKDSEDLEPGTTPYYARMHKWIKRAVLVCLVALVIEGTAGLTVRVKVAVPVPPAFVALSDTDEVPLAVGVPEIAPVVVFTLKPAGSPVAP